MLVFIDESGDTGLKLDSGASRFFTIAMVVFEDTDEATACDQRIELLKKELGWQPGSEFHFVRNSDKVRKTFLEAVRPYNFFYYGMIINKDPAKLWGDGFRSQDSFYKYVCGLVFENAKSKLEEAIVVIDGSSNLGFKQQLAKYLRRKMNNSKKKLIRKVKTQDSHKNNLIQLADYVAGALNRSMQVEKKFAQDYRSLISHREIYIQIWPKI